MTKIFIHSVVHSGMQGYTCHYPGCPFITSNLTEVAEHVIKNQFEVKEPVRKKPVNLFKI